MRWLAVVGTDYGAVTVAADSPFKTLKDVLAAVKADPTKVVFGAGGTVGSQDWMKAALTARAAGVDPRAMRFVDIDWPIFRGFYVGPKVSDADYKVWADTFKKMMASPEFEKLRAERGLYPLSMSGPEVDTFVKKQVTTYRTLVKDFGLATAK